MSAGLVNIRVRVDAGDFSSNDPIVTFQEVVSDFNSQPPDITARIVGYSYNSDGREHDVRLVLTPPGQPTGTDQDIPIRIESGINSFTSLCGPDGIVVPRRYGLSSDAQPPATPGDAVVSGETYQVYFSTQNKIDAGTFYLWYQIDGLDAVQ